MAAAYRGIQASCHFCCIKYNLGLNYKFLMKRRNGILILNSFNPVNNGKEYTQHKQNFSAHNPYCVRIFWLLNVPHWVIICTYVALITFLICSSHRLINLLPAPNQMEPNPHHPKRKTLYYKMTLTDTQINPPSWCWGLTKTCKL